MAENLHLEVVTPRRQVLSEDVAAVTLPGALGEFQVFPNHRPLLTSLTPGRFIVADGSSTRTYYLGGGFAEILSGRVVLLADECILKDDIDLAGAKKALAKAEKALEARKHDDYDATKSERRALERAQLQIKIAEASE